MNSWRQLLIKYFNFIALVGLGLGTDLADDDDYDYVAYQLLKAADREHMVKHRF